LLNGVKKLYLKEQIRNVLTSEAKNIGANVLGFWSLEKDFIYTNEIQGCCERNDADSCLRA
jgi:hypothetical protein